MRVDAHPSPILAGSEGLSDLVEPRSLDDGDSGRAALFKLACQHVVGDQIGLTQPTWDDAKRRTINAADNPAAEVADLGAQGAW